MPHDTTTCPTAAQLLELYPVFQATPFTSGFQAWTLDVVGVAAGPYLVNVDLQPSVFPAGGGESLTDIRDGLLAAIAATPHTTFIETPSGGTVILLTSIVDGRGLVVTTNLGPTGAEMTLVETTALTPGEIIHQALEFASCIVCDWGCNTFQGCLNAAVHWLKMWNDGQSTGGGPSGQVVSMTQGPYSVSFAQSQAASGSDGWWGGSPEGQQFLFLRKQQGPRPISLRSGQACFQRGPFGLSGSRRSLGRRGF